VTESRQPISDTGRHRGAVAGTALAEQAVVARVLSAIAGLLVVVSTTAGLFVSDFYRLVDPALLPGTYGQDWMSLALVPILGWAMRSAMRESLHARVIWLGLLVYYTYGYALYAFGPQYTPLYPLYVAILGLSVFAAVDLSRSLDVDACSRRLRDRLPARGIIALFAAIVVFLTPVWIAMMLSAIRHGTPSLFATVHVLDLAFVFPVLGATAVGLWRRRRWSYAAVGPLLVLSATMMGSLVVSEAIAALRFTPDPLPLAFVFALIALVSTILTLVCTRALTVAHSVV